MAREHARIWLDINADDDFEKLPFDAQGFYCRVILTLDDLSWCGVADWRPRKLTTKAPDLTYERIQRAAWDLEAGRFCLFDVGTEEVLARSFIRRDELLRNPKYGAAVVKAYGGIASKMLRAAVVTEIRRVHDEHPEYSSWSHADVGPALSKIMAKAGLDEVDYLPQITIPNPVLIGNGKAVSIGNAQSVPITNPDSVPIGNPVGNADSVPIPSTYTSTSTPAPLEGLRKSGTSPEDPNPDDPPPRFCPDHRPDGTNETCGPCKSYRLIYERWFERADLATKKALQADARREIAERDERLAAEAAEHAQAVVACGLCDDDGRNANGMVCDHVDRSGTAAAGMAKIRAALAPKETPDGRT